MEHHTSAYKLKGFGPIYYLNVDRHSKRRQHIESQLASWSITDHTRISAYDGRDDDVRAFIAGTYPETLTVCEVACVISHLKAIHHWYHTSTTPYAIVMEDDCELGMAEFWNFTWQEFIRCVPDEWDVIQLAVIIDRDILAPIHKRSARDYSTACYAITRHHAERLILKYIHDDLYRLDHEDEPCPVADELIYNCGVTYSVPLLLYNTELGSSIHPKHVEKCHISSYAAIQAFWQQRGRSLSVEHMTRFNPDSTPFSQPDDCIPLHHD